MVAYPTLPTSSNQPTAPTKTPAQDAISANGLTIDVAALHGLLIDLAATASTDATLPMLCGVLLHTDTTSAGDGVLVGTSTDRYLLAQAHTPVTAGELPETFIELHGVHTLITALSAWSPHDDADDYDEDDDGNPIPASPQPAGPPAGLPVRLVRDGDTLRLTVVDVEVRVPVARTEFPTRHLPRLFTDECSATTVSIQPTMWRTLERIAEHRRSVITMAIQGDEKPVRVHIGRQYRALVMPYRADAVEPAPPAFLPPSAAGPRGDRAVAR